jgi:hypothetical protein
MQKLIRTRGIVIRVVVYGGLVAFILYLAFRPNIHDRAWFNVSRMDIFSFVTAMESYKDAYGTYPTGDNPTVFGALRGNNPKKLIYWMCILVQSVPTERSLIRGKLLTR